MSDSDISKCSYNYSDCYSENAKTSADWEFRFGKRAKRFSSSWSSDESYKYSDESRHSIGSFEDRRDEQESGSTTMAE